MISGFEISCFQQLLYYLSYMCEHCYLVIDDRGQMLHLMFHWSLVVRGLFAAHLRRQLRVLPSKCTPDSALTG